MGWIYLYQHEHIYDSKYAKHDSYEEHNDSCCPGTCTSVEHIEGIIEASEIKQTTSVHAGKEEQG